MLHRTRTFLRRLRGLIGNGLVWAAGWVLGTLSFTVAPLLIAGVRLPFLGTVLANVAFIGFVSGAVFSIGLHAAYGHRLLEDLRPSRLGFLGAAAGLFFPAGLFVVAALGGVTLPAIVVVSNLAIAGGLGWATSVGSLRIARMGAGELPGSHVDRERPLISGSS